MPDFSVLGDKDAHFARTRGALDARMKHLSVNNRESSECWMPPSSKPLYTCLGVLDAASIKATTCQESTTQLNNSWNTQECQVPLQATNVLSSPPGCVCPFTAWWDCTELQLFELVHSAP